MAMKVQCKCGWSSPVSEFYLGDHLCCPECNTRIHVHTQTGKPYGYPAYPTWQKRPAAAPRAKARPARFHAPKDPYATASVWSALVAFILTVSVCGLLPGMLASVVSLHLVSQSRRFNGNFNQPVPAHTRSATWLASLSLVLGAILAAVLVAGHTFNAAAPVASNMAPAVRSDSTQVMPESREQRRAALQEYFNHRNSQPPTAPVQTAPDEPETPEYPIVIRPGDND